MELKVKRFNLICEEIATSTKGLESIIKEQQELDPAFPCRRTVYLWMRDDEKLRKQYELAKRCQIENLIDEIIEIADDTTHDFVMNEHGNEVLNKEHVQRSRVRIDTRKWLAGKLKPTLYGDAEDLRRVLEQQQIEIRELKKAIHG